MHVGVLGGGLQGCCVAIALAERGLRVTIFDRNEQLLSRTAVANEGKVHLGFMYAGDPSLSTARMMMRGAIAFAPFFSNHLGLGVEKLALSEPAAYVVHKDSQSSAEAVSDYLERVRLLLEEYCAGVSGDYFGIDLHEKLYRWRQSEVEEEFDPAAAVAVFSSPEVAINPVVLARAVRECVSAHPAIDLRLQHFVRSVERDESGLRVISECDGHLACDPFDHVVNALWDGRLAINESLGYRANRPWMHRLKYGVSCRLPTNARRPRSATFVLGPFGEVVSYPDGLTYLTWYPACLHGISMEVSPPTWATYPEEPLRSSILTNTLAAMSEFILPLRALTPDDLSEATVKGGTIVAWGATDIYDPRSELHRRFEIGVTSADQFHSVDPGKLTMAPFFASVCADRITGCA